MKNKHLGMEVLEEHQFADIFREMREAIDGLENGVRIHIFEDDRKVERKTPGIVDFLKLAAAAIRDGFPTQTMQGSSAASVLDEEGHAMPPVGDPVGELATADSLIADPIRKHAHSAMRGLSGALGDLRLARSSLITGSQYANIGPGEPGCTSHARLERHVAVFRDDLCSWCYRFRLAEHQDPPIELLELKDKNVRITEHMVKASLTRPKQRRAQRAS